MGVNARGSIITDIPNEIQTGEKLQILAIPHTKLAEVLITYEETINPSGFAFMWYYPPENTMAKVKQLYMQVTQPFGGASGTHYFEMYVGANKIVTKGRATYSSPIQFNYSHWYQANSQQLPTNVEAQGQSVRDMVATSEIPITFIYSNNMNVPQTNNITIKLTVELWSMWI